MSALARLPALADFDPTELGALEDVTVIEAFGDTDVIVREGDTDRSLYFLLDGRCLIVRQTEQEDLRFSIDAGGMIGVVGLVGGGGRSATVLADGPVRVARLTPEAFENIRKSGGSAAFKLELAIARQLAQDFAAMNGRLRDSVETTRELAEPKRRVERERLRSYSGLHEMTAEVHRPAALSDAVAVFSEARRLGRRVTLHGAGLSFDSQGIGSDVLLSLSSFDEIKVQPDQRTVTVGAGATWGAIVAACSAHGLVPAVVVSGSDITAAGTASCNALSRFSVIFGKEGKWIRELDLLLANGERVRASRTESPELFFAAIGGFGLVGVILRVTYELLPIGTPIRVESWLERVPEIDDLSAKLVRAPTREATAETAYAVVAFKDDEIRSIVTRSRYVTEPPLRKMLPHQPANVTRLPIEMAIHNVAAAGQKFWNFAYERYIDEDLAYVDELDGYTFFMDGNVRTRRASAKMGMPFTTVQQTYVLPSGGDTDLVAPFVRLCRERVERESLHLALVDILHLPADEPFLLSSTRGIAGFALTLTFEGVHEVQDINRLRACLVELTQETRRLGGRVHLTKNVFATHDDLQAMYGDGLRSLAGIKRRHDPSGLLGSDFAARLFRRG